MLQCFHYSWLPTSCYDQYYPCTGSQSGDLLDRNNYRPIALASVVSKVFELMLLNRCEQFIYSADNQFSFKSGLSTDLRIYTLKDVINHYKSSSSHVFLCFMDASKAFDMVNHWTIIVRILYIW